MGIGLSVLFSPEWRSGLNSISEQPLEHRYYEYPSDHGVTRPVLLKGIGTLTVNTFKLPANHGCVRIWWWHNILNYVFSVSN